MSRRPGDAARERPEEAPGSSADALQSGIVCKEELVPEPGGAPPWEVVLAYLSRGEHRAWVEGHAAESRAFAEVLAALRNDQEERGARRR